MLYYSALTNSIYDDEIAPQIPEDSIKISEYDYLQIQKELSKGSVLVVGKDGNPTTEIISEINTPQISKKEDEVYWRNFELNFADIELCKVQDADPKSYGSVSEWRLYRKQLRAWPDDVNFPNQEFRPSRPIKTEG